MMGARRARGHRSRARTSTRSATADEALLRTRVEGVAAARHRADPLHLAARPPTRAARCSATRRSCARGWSPPASGARPPRTALWSALPLFHVTALGTRHVGARHAARRSSATTRSTPTRTRRDAARRADHAVLSGLPAGHRGRARAPGLRQGRPERDPHVGSTSRRRRCWRSSRSACRTPSS